MRTGSGFLDDADRRIREFLGGVYEMRQTECFFDRFERDSITSGGLRLHADVIEVNEKSPTVVFMPGTNAYAVLYGEFLAALADAGYNIVGFDPRGHGRSEGRRGSYTVPELMADMRAAIRYARRRFGDPVVVSGSSQGGITAFYVAAEGYPVAGALCHNIADLGDPSSVSLTAHPTFSRYAKPLVTAAARLCPEFRVPMTLYIDLASEPIRGLGNSREVLKSGALLVPFVRLKGMASLAGEKLPCPVEDVSSPVMVLHGARDVIFPESYVRAIYDRLTCSKRMKVYDGFHHYILFDNVDAVAPDAVEWLQEICG